MTTTMTTTMKAAVVTEFGKDLQIQTLPVPEPGRGEALVKVADPRLGRLPHRPARRRGRLAGQADPAVHSRPRRRRLRRLPSARASPTWPSATGSAMPWLYSACGDCQHCLGGWETLCEASRTPATRSNGCLRRVHAGRQPVCRPACRRRLGLRRGRPGALRRRHRLQGPEGDRAPSPATGSRSPASAGSATWPSSTPVAMGLNVAAVDIDDAKLDLARRLGADADGQRAARGSRRRSSSARPAAVPMACW